MFSLELTDVEAAAILRVQPETVRRRVRAGELNKKRVRGRDVVLLEPARTWLRVEDVGALLNVTPATVRAAIGRGELAGRRERGGRWRVRLQSVLDDRRCDPDVVAQFGGEPPVTGTVPRARPPGARAQRLRRSVFVQLDANEVELLELARDTYGTNREAVVMGLRAIADDGATPTEAAELRTERDLHREAAEQARDRAATLAALARRGLVDELYCPTCDQLVPIEQAGHKRLEDGTVELYHKQHGHRTGGRVRTSTVMARRRPLDDDTAHDA